MSFDLQWLQDDSIAGRLSISRRGMAVLRQALGQMEVLVDLEPGELTPDSTREEAEKVLSYRAETPKRIPGQKLESADGWLIDAEECSFIIHAIDELLQDPFKFGIFNGVVSRVRGPGETEADDRKFLETVAKYCRRAASVGGFRVL